DRKRETRKFLKHSIDEGLYQRKEIPATDTQDARTQTEDDLTGDDLKQYEADIEAMNLILISITNDIYNSVDACQNAIDMWNRVKRLMHGTDLSETKRESHFVNEFDKFIVEPGESLSSMYNRFSQLINDMDRNIVKPEVNNVGLCSLVFLGVQFSSVGSDLGVQFCEVVVSYGYQNSWKKSDEISDEMLADLYNYAMLKEDDIVDVILEDLWMKYGKYDKGKGKVHDLENIIEKLEVDKEAKHAEHAQLKVNKDDKGKGKVHDLDLENRIKKLEVNFGSMLKAKKAKQAENDHLKVNKEVIQISSDGDVFSDEGVFGDEDIVLINDVKYPLTDDEIIMFKGETHKI
ncbi:hypothetical protein Tco_1239246, partial [Tanacetum coccineum]